LLPVEDVVAANETKTNPAAPWWRDVATALRARKAALAGMVVFLLVALVALFAPLLAPHDPVAQSLVDNLKPPMWLEGGTAVYPLGTDPLGRDLLSRLMYGARYSLMISFASVLLGGTLGFAVGLVSGYFGGAVDTVLMRVGDVQFAFPFVLFAIAVLAVSPERTPLHLILVLSISSWIIYARVVRSRVLSERAKDYALAARALGASHARVLFRYIVPNVWQVVPLIALLDLGFLVIVESLLSFISLGLSPPTPSWGSILADGRQYMMISPWMAIFPGLAIVVTVLSISLAADGMADYFDPKLGHGKFRRIPLQAPHPRRLPLTPNPSPLREGRGEHPAHARPKPHSPVPHGPGALWAAGLGGEGQPPLLQVRNLTTIFPTRAGVIEAVRDASFTLGRGEVLGVVGESGSGKSTLGLSIIQLLDAPGRVTQGEILFDGKDLARVGNAEMAAIRGARIGMIFQDPGASLNPVLTAGAQLEETLRQHRKLAPAAAREAARQALQAVHIADPERVLRAYPFQLSGGMQQRVMIALAMASQPDLLILDEPTSSLDVTTQAQLLDELSALRERSGASMIFITHDIALLAGIADAIVVMYAGQICESGPRDQVIDAPRHPYTQALLNAVERVEVWGGERLATIPGDPPDPARLPPGCPFAPRCPFAMPVCVEINPEPIEVAPGHAAACHLLDPMQPTAREARGVVHA
jgi:peptide/nickel transport system permease protein